MTLSSVLTRALILLFLASLSFSTGCTRLQLAYGTAPLFLKGYAKDYLAVDSDQMATWDPRLGAALDTHRAVEIPQVAGFIEAFHQASIAGFDASNTRCLSNTLRELYRRHARLAVDTAAPLLAHLRPTQVQHLERRFAEEYRTDRLTDRPDIALLQAQRARRYIKSVEGWTGTLTASQRALVTDLSRRIPNTEEAVFEYRTLKRKELVRLLRSGADETSIRRFLTDWLVDFRDLPPALAGAFEQVQQRWEELLIRLGPTLDTTQRRRLDDQLSTLREDLMQIQKAPRLVPVSCRA
jgi:hypothetical protein